VKVLAVPSVKQEEQKEEEEEKVPWMGPRTEMDLEGTGI
jgi:hypothetical protein